ncbi:MAG: XRE family transcriptional regulator [Cytophagales bacterium]|nr:XRE family transcriptional regulator [Bernardetiaceae bacterium]MDW8205249.1 XRE family transcriptional regulator [Cytophagales bacterium]
MSEFFFSAKIRHQLTLRYMTRPSIRESAVKLLFGLKIRQLRAEKNISQSELAEKAGLSVSYLNEIEKGKKLPKVEKIALLADALGVSYDWLVSLQTQKSLMPVAELLRTNLLEELPLEFFGIDKSQLFDILSVAPAKLNAFINTIIEISRNYGMKVEHIYFSALRSYQEMHENYFDDIEQQVEACKQQYGIHQFPLHAQKLMHILKEFYHYQIEEDGLTQQPELQELRSVTLKGKQPRLLLNKDLSETQKCFILGRELGFQFMNISDRSYTTSWVEVNSFEQAVNNFKGSYFSCALFLPREQFIVDLKNIFQSTTFSSELLLALLHKYQVAPELFYHRLTNLLPRFFGLRELFFLRFSNRAGTELYDLSKELHLSGLQAPHASMLNEHYCRRWVSIQIIKELRDRLLSESNRSDILCKAQRSKYYGLDKEYLIISMAKPSFKGSPVIHSVSIGFLVNSALKKSIRFWNDPAIPIRLVGETCERCMATDCESRAAEPTIYRQEQRVANLKAALEALQRED